MVMLVSRVVIVVRVVGSYLTRMLVVLLLLMEPLVEARHSLDKHVHLFDVL